MEYWTKQAKLILGLNTCSCVMQHCHLKKVKAHNIYERTYSVSELCLVMVIYRGQHLKLPTCDCNVLTRDRKLINTKKFLWNGAQHFLHQVNCWENFLIMSWKEVKENQTTMPLVITTKTWVSITFLMARFHCKYFFRWLNYSNLKAHSCSTVVF